MFKHNFLLILRNIKRNRTSFFINLIGLSTGLSCVLLIFLWVRDELSVDKFHENDKQLYQVMQNIPDNDGIVTMEYTPGLLAEALAEEIPEVEYAAAVIPSWFINKALASYENKHIKLREYYASEDFFKVFSYPLIVGDEDRILKNKNEVVISDDLAKKLFNTTENIIGKSLEWNRENFQGQYTVSGIFKKPPSNSTAQFDIVFNYKMFLDHYTWINSWKNSDPYTYIVLKENTDIVKFNAKIADFVQQKQSDDNTKLFVRKYSDKYLYNSYENGILTGGRIAYVKLFSVIAIFILIIACINFMNLSTAKASTRLKETGIKKVNGINRNSLVLQFITESILMAFISFIIAFFLVIILLPQFNEITSKNLDIGFNINLILTIVGIVVLTGLLAGSYPALFFSGIRPANILKGKINSPLGELLTRKGLVILQFTASLVMIVMVLVVYKQINYIQNKNLGYNKNNIIYFDSDNVTETFMIGINNIPGVKRASIFLHDMTGDYGMAWGFSWDDCKSGAGDLKFVNLEVGYGFVETLGMVMIAGRSFSQDYGSEKQIILNETAIKKMEIENPVGKNFNFWGENREIVGIVKDFHFESLYEGIKPCFLQLVPVIPSSKIMVKMQTGSEKETLNRINNFFSEYNPDVPFEFTFLDEDYQKLYEAETRTGILSQYFGGLAVLISCLGLFGLATFTADRRTKEFGIRKTLGSAAYEIAYLLTGDFTKMLLISVFIAMPVSYLIARNWLNDFTYRIQLNSWYFFIAGLFVLLTAWLTVAMHAIRVARINPVDCIKDE